MLIPVISPRSLYNMHPIQKIANKIGEHVPDKISHFFEMNQVGEIDRIPLVMLSFLFVLGARFFKSRDHHERREVLTRDGLTIGVAMMGVPIVKKWMLHGLDKVSKIPTSVESFDNLKNWYAKANMMPEKALSVAKNIKEHGGDVATAFSKLGRLSQNYIETMLNGAEYNSENILTALENASKSADGTNMKKAFNSLTHVLSDKRNGLVAAAQRLKAIPALASILLITTLLGWGIPAFNIHFTRNKLKHHHRALEPEITDSQKQVISKFLTKA